MQGKPWSEMTTLLFSIDGMRPDGLQTARTPNIDRLIAEGASTMNARTVMPSVTLPCHTSMHRGVDVARHGITTNIFQPLARPVPSVFDVASRNGLKTGFFFNWHQLRDLCDPESLSVSFCYNHMTPEGDLQVRDAAIKHILGERLDFAFVYFGWTDGCGHEHGWMSPEYIQAIEHADRCVGDVLKACSQNGGLRVLLQSDHGGHERAHGTEMPEDMTIPWMVHGPGVRPGAILNGSVRIFDTCTTLAAWMGLPRAPEWDGRVVAEAFDDLA